MSNKNNSVRPPWPCLFNEAVLCNEQKCEKCGWNPKVAKDRLSKFCAERGVQNPVRVEE